MAHSRLLVASPETVLAVAVRGEVDPEGEPGEAEAGPTPRKRSTARKSAAPALKDPA
jgi:hypothetical protein